ncbi:MAG: tetratricopeptide repeat protein [Spirochaetaceae bacterium]|jgi:outer membrane protein assembly factor BamD (BamD/ComL family)|nr:tetratricopeptide repeat protein [Spirochaetaceae bacterium]
MYRRCLLFAFLFLLFSCASGPVNVPPDMPPSKIIQKAQEAADVNKYNMALEYYKVLLERYGDEDEYLAVAEYEIAFIHYKQKNYAVARKGFETLLTRYRQERNALPPQFKTLSEKMLNRLKELGH